MFVQALRKRNNFNIRIQSEKRCTRRVYFRCANRIGAIKDLPLQVGEVYFVGVGEGELADAAGRQIERRGATQAAGADDQRVRRAQPLLALDPYLVEKDVAAVAEELLVVQVVKISSLLRPAWSARPRASGP